MMLMRVPTSGLSLVTLLAVTPLLVTLTLWPQIDLGISRLFYTEPAGFPANQHWFFNLLHDLASRGSWLLALLLVVGILLAFFLKRRLAGYDGKALLFLLLALLIGPGLIANEILKDEWGRARPRQIVEFGGSASFTPPLVLADQCENNCSFVSGDGSFGFYLPAFGLVAATTVWRRRLFWGGMAAGCVFGFARIAMGAHFFSDVVYAAVFMVLTISLMFRLMYGKTAARQLAEELGFRRSN